MKQPNFFQKHLVTIIIILLFVIAIIIGINQGFNDYQNEKNYLSPLEQTPTNPSRMKRSTEETSQLKIKTTAARLEKIKNYLFTEPDNPPLLPTNLSEREQEEINKLKNSWRLSLGYLKESQTDIDEEQKVCDEHQSQLNSIQPQIEALKPKQQKLEQQKEAKEKEIIKKQEVWKQFKYLPNQTEEVRKKRKENYDLLQAEIEKLQDEKQKIIEEISEVKLQIKNLETDQKYYQDMLSGAEMLKKDFVKSYERLEKEYRNQILNSLNSLYEITPTEL
ncbi:hypothetical protein [Candidatus Phytoplasma australiense]|uniref:Uncharacterized protein n=1 Tax=Strawberry lethal yellows phytoplasma (CPA) str. NZSb11 TaxID=980422 RepID=R4RQ50_PHYAS|nr:hypothetical protein [Candidatus Phytoplasma australiense]AGL90631.1 Hypothetical Protein yibP [Strawberry lethal yellows phytoplasma (CPA) str. NZSb11]